MAFYHQQPTAFGYSSFGYPTQFGAPVAQPIAPRDAASQHEGSQAGDVQSHSVSGFAAQPIDAGFGGFYGQPTFIGQQQFGAPAAFPAYGQATVLPGATVLPAQYGQTFVGQTALVPVAQPQIRRPGYNERLVAWRNRQKAFNRYKRSTKEAIKNANSAQYHHHNTLLAQSTVLAPAYGSTVFGAAPIYGGAYGQSTIIQGAYPAYGATFLPQAYPVGGFAQQGAVFTNEQHDAQENYGQDFSNYSAGQQEVQAEEPEIRGTQV